MTTRCSPSISAPTKKSYKSFTACLPFGGQIRYDGVGLEYVPGPAVADGQYGSFTIANNCIASAGPGEIPIYTPAPCALTPEPCGDTSGGLVIAPGAENLSANVNNQLMTKLYMENGENVVMSGAGTQTSPLKVSVGSLANDTSVTVDAEHLTITGDGAAASPFHIAHKKPAAIGGSNYGGFTLDTAGHITAYAEPSAGGSATSIQGVAGVVDVTTQSSVAVISLPSKFQTAQTIPLGSHNLTVDMQGRVEKIEVISGDAIAPGRHSMIFQGSRTASTFTFEALVAGRFRGSYKGNLGIDLVSVSLENLPADITVTVDELPITALAVVEGNKVVGVEFLTPSSYASGVHVVTINTTEPVTFSGMMDIVICP